MEKLKTVAEVFEMIEPADPDSIRPLGNNEFVLNWLKSGYTPDQRVALCANKQIAALVGPYRPSEEPHITHQIRIKVQ